MFGGLFGNDKSSDSDELALYQKIDVSQFDALSEYIQQWAQLFEGKGMGLTTPVSVEPVAIENGEGARILFKKVDTGYSDKDYDNNDGESSKKKKKKEIKQGGVEILVEKDADSIQVRASRCEIEEGTMIKEMSEETIVKELAKAMDVWKKQQ